MIKGVITDGDGVLNFPQKDKKVQALLNFLRLKRIQHIVISNNRKTTIKDRFKRLKYPQPDLIVTPVDLVKPIRKPSPKLIEHALDVLGHRTNELIYVGDDTKTDIFCAINAGVLPIGATYSKSKSAKYLDYCVKISSISDLIKFIQMFGGMDSPFFGWELSHKTTDLRCALYDHGIIKPHFTNLVKQNKDKLLNSGYHVSQLVKSTLVSQIFLSGLSKQADVITAYPGHIAGSRNVFINTFLDQLGKISRIPKRELLIRHTTSSSSRITNNRDLENQINTIHLDPDEKIAIKDRHVIVFDDFSTSGTSLESAKILLLRGGAKKVTQLAFGKYRYHHTVYKLSKAIDPYSKNIITESDYSYKKYSSSSNTDKYFRDHILPFFK